MNTISIEIENKVTQFLDVLKRDIQRSEDALLTLDQLRSSVIKRDDLALSKILARIKAQSNNNKDIDIKRQLLRRDLANALNCSCDQVTLTRLETELPGEIKTQVSSVKANLMMVTEKLRTEYFSTAMLLSECTGLTGCF